MSLFTMYSMLTSRNMHFKYDQFCLGMVVQLVYKHARLTLYRSTASVRVQALKYCCFPRQQWIYLSNFIDVSWLLTLILYCLGNSAMDYSITMSRGNTTTHTLHLLHHGRTSSFGRVLDECNVFFTYFSGIRGIFLMLLFDFSSLSEWKLKSFQRS